MTPLPLSLRLSATLMLIAGIGTGVQAEIYKWTDAQGNTHYTQTPPSPQEKSSDVKTIGDDIGMAAGIATNSDSNIAAQPVKKDEMASAREAGKNNQVKHKTFCDQQKSALKQLLANPVIRWKSADKKDRILSAKERKDKIKTFEKTIQDMCNADVLASKDKVGTQ